MFVQCLNSSQTQLKGRLGYFRRIYLVHFFSFKEIVMHLFHGLENVVLILKSGTQGQVPQSFMRTPSCRQGASKAVSTRVALREEHGESGTTLMFAVRTVTQMHV